MSEKMTVYELKQLLSKTLDKLDDIDDDQRFIEFESNTYFLGNNCRYFLGGFAKGYVSLDDIENHIEELDEE